VIIGLVILVAAVFGYHVTGSTGPHVNGGSPVGDIPAATSSPAD
jgi:hypothetical protein